MLVVFLNTSIKVLKGAALFLLFPLIFYACHHEENEGPVIQFVVGGGNISSDTVLSPGQAFRVGLHAENLITDITNLQIKRVYDGGEEVVLDTGIHNATFDFAKILNKGVYDTETWIFRVTDQDGKRASVSFVLSNDPGSQYDSVRCISSLILGAQSCSTVGSFYAPGNDSVFFLDQAFLNQDSIHFCYYFDASGDANTLASPGANIDTSIFGGTTGLYFWTVKNETRFYETTLSVASFDAVVNDSLLIASYDVLNAKRKAKNLATGEVYSFKTAQGKFGLFKVIEVIGAAEGTIEITMKIQL